MAEGKKGFMLYADLIYILDKLDDVQAGKLFKHILAYVNDKNPVAEDKIVDLVFEPIKWQLKRDLVKREERAERSRANGALGGRPPWQPREPTRLPNNPKKPNGLQNNPDEPKKPDNVNVTVNDTDNVSVTNSETHAHDENFIETGTDQEIKKDPDWDQYDKTERVLQQRHAEHYGAYLAQVWEKHTGKATLVTDAIKRRVLNMRQTPAVDMEKYIETYAELCNFIEKHAIDKHIYFPIRQYDLDKFLDKVNSFTTDSITILGNIALKESKSKVLAMRKKDHNIVDEVTTWPPPVVEEIKEMTEEQKQKAKEQLAGFKKNMLEKTAT